MTRTALITGALGGIGQALCVAFRDAGYRVIGSDARQGPAGTEAFLQFDICTFARDHGYREQTLQQLRELAGPDGLHVLVNNAAVQLLNSTERVTVDELHETLDTNLVGPFLLLQGLLGELERAGGSVINIGSIHATATKPGFVCYATSKAALVGLTRNLAVDLGPRVRVNAINPAATATPMLLAGFEGNDEGFQALRGMHPLQRIAEPIEVAAVAVFLASSQASFITGAALSVDGGIGARLHDPA
jgi:NAD(P)-dependent dehydrogenase (short-subunit alcohol dehydrogenase family)